MDKPSVLLDFDGTVVDSTDALLEALAVFSQERTFVLPDNARELLQKLGWKHFLLSLKFPEAELPSVVETICNTVAGVRGKVQTLPGMSEVLHSLRQSCDVLGVVTSNSEMNVRRILSQEQVQLFDLIQAGGISNKGELLQRIVEVHTLDPRSTYYVGDEVRDIEATKPGGLQSIAVLWGVSDEETLRSAKPDFLVSHPQEIETILLTR